MFNDEISARIPPAPTYCRPSISWIDRKSTRLNSSHLVISYAVFCLKKKQRIEMSFDDALSYQLFGTVPNDLPDLQSCVAVCSLCYHFGLLDDRVHAVYYSIYHSSSV